MPVAENDSGWRPTYEACWQCKKRVRSDEAICVWCGATRIPPAAHNRLWTPPEPTRGPSSFPHAGGMTGPQGMRTGDFAQPGGGSPLGVAVPLSEEAFDPYQSSAPSHPYEFQPPAPPTQSPHDWRLPPAPAPTYVPSTGPLSWDGDLSVRGRSGQAASPSQDAGAALSEDTLEHPQLPRQAPPMQQLGRVRLVQEQHGDAQANQSETDASRMYRDGPPDRGLRLAPDPAPQAGQPYGYAPQGDPAQPSGYGYAPQPAFQPDYQQGYDPRYGAGQPGYGQQPGYQYGFDPSAGASQPDYGYQYGYDSGNGHGYAGQRRQAEPPPGQMQQIVDQIWDAVHAEEALAWLEAKAREVLPYVQQFLPGAEQLAPEKNMTSRRVMNLLTPIGLGCVGGFIGGAIWCSAVSAIHAEVGLFALPMAYLIGWGVRAGSLRRGLLPVLLSVFITIGAWSICLAIISHLGLTITILEIPFLLMTVVTSILPMRSMKRERWERR